MCSWFPSDFSTPTSPAQTAFIWHLQAGLGINPNGSKTEVEYFFGSALTSHGIYFAPGLHIARASYLGGGFSLGEVIPSGVTPPVNYRATYRFAFAISYSPPVKGGS